jgi:hypothetical protein
VMAGPGELQRNTRALLASSSDDRDVHGPARISEA